MDEKEARNNEKHGTDSLVLALGGRTYTVEQVYVGDRTIQEVVSDFLERTILNTYNN